MGVTYENFMGFVNYSVECTNKDFFPIFDVRIRLNVVRKNVVSGVLWVYVLSIKRDVKEIGE